MKLKLMATLAIATIFGLLSQTAEAATFKLSYTNTDAKTLQAQVEGLLAADGNTVTVTGISDVTLDGVAVTVALTKIRSVSSALLDPNLPVEAILTLDGSVLDIFATDSTDDDGFYALAGFPGFGDTIFATGWSFGGYIESLNRPGYKLTAVAAVPLPAGGLLLLSGLGLLALRRKR